MTAQDLFTEREAAIRLKVSESSLYRARRAGVLRFCRLGKLVRYTPAQLDAWLEAVERGGESVPIN